MSFEVLGESFFTINTAMAWNKMWNFLREHPRLTISMCVAGCMPLADCFLKRMATKGLIRPVYAKMEVGSKPLRSTVIGRPEVLEEVKVAIGFSQRLPGVVSRDVDEDDLDKGTGFCVIVGPSGTGKTVCLTQICNESPKGALYVEIVSANNVRSCEGDLHENRAIRYNRFSIRIFIKLYHELPDDKDERLSVIMNVLKKASKMFQAKYEKMPILFIDGIDVLAKKDKDLVTFLLSHAKYLANQDILSCVY